MLSVMASMAVREQMMINRFQPGANRAFQRPGSFDTGPRQPAAKFGQATLAPDLVQFFPTQPKVPAKMDLPTFLAAVFQKIHPTILRFWRNQAQETPRGQRSWRA